MEQVCVADERIQFLSVLKLQCRQKTKLDRYQKLYQLMTQGQIFNLCHQFLYKGLKVYNKNFLIWEKYSYNLPS